ncbi:MAG: AraC family transcriptional regulator [Hungatella sp.]
MEKILFSEAIDGLVADQVVRDFEYSMTSRHFHDTYELYYLLEGERYYFIDKETYLVKQGDVVLVKPNQIHKTSMAENSYHNRILLQIGSAWLNPFLQGNEFLPLEELYAANDGIIALSESDRVLFELLLFQLRDELQGRRGNYGLMVKLKLTELLIVLSRYKKTAVFERENQKVQTTKHQKVHEVADYLLTHAETAESLEELAKRFYISKSYLSRIFREVTGFTVNEYRAVTRIKKAQNLLIHSDYSVTEISEILGFESITYFERVFKKYVDNTPLKYRYLDSHASHRAASSYCPHAFKDLLGGQGDECR